MDKKLIPYSVHLPENIFNAIKQAAGDRKAASLVREAIIQFVEKRNMFDQGFNAGLEAAIKKTVNHKVVSVLSYKGEALSDSLVHDFESLLK